MLSFFLKQVMYREATKTNHTLHQTGFALAAKILLGG